MRKLNLQRDPAASTWCASQDWRAFYATIYEAVKWGWRLKRSSVAIRFRSPLSRSLQFYRACHGPEPFVFLFFPPQKRLRISGGWRSRMDWLCSKPIILHRFSLGWTMPREKIETSNFLWDRIVNILRLMQIKN